MPILATLQSISHDVAQLECYLQGHFEEVYDFFNNEKYSVLSSRKNEIQKYLALNIQRFKTLDVTNRINFSFVALLLEVSERFGFLGEFKLLYEQLQGRAFRYGLRLDAAAGYLVGIKTGQDYLNRFDSIYDILQEAYETEEDSEVKVITTIVNYYAQVIYNFEFSPQFATDLNQKIQERRLMAGSFLQHPLVGDVLSVSTIPYNESYHSIHTLLDRFLGRDIHRIYSTDELLIEEGSDYSEILATINSDFNSIRQVSTMLNGKLNDDSVFQSLQRGVKILTVENQLYAYLHSYGNMHYNKLISSFECLQEGFFQKSVRIIDWGCGQGLATISYFDFLNSRSTEQDVRQITLIEPSTVALKRASLHVKKCWEGNNILAINKDLDALLSEDLSNSIPTNKLHLFSNILDVDDFSLSKLTALISERYKGQNYFVCASPFINDVKTSRIDAFVNHFVHAKGFELIYSINSKSGQWLKTWTRVLRIFKVTL